MTIKELKELALHAAKNTAPSTFSVDTVHEAVRDGFKELGGSINNFMKNKYDIFEIIIKAADEVVPNKVINSLGVFAEIQSVPQGQKAIFRRKVGVNRAKKFLTQVGLSGLYETFRLDNETYTVSGQAIGGAATIDFERFLDGAENMADLMNIITEGLTEAVFHEIHKALRAAINATGRPENNYYSGNSFDAEEMVRLVNTVRSYGSGAVIFAPPEFVAAMGPDAIVPVGTNYAGTYSPKDIEAIHDNGFINIFRGTPIVQIPQSFVDENNEKTWIDPQIAYILPTTHNKVVKVVLEGDTQMWDFVNADQSIEIHTYKKIGVAIEAHHNWAIYQNKGIEQTMADSPYGV